jgi:hypothetical protein
MAPLQVAGLVIVYPKRRASYRSVIGVSKSEDRRLRALNGSKRVPVLVKLAVERPIYKSASAAVSTTVLAADLAADFSADLTAGLANVLAADLTADLAADFNPD